MNKALFLDRDGVIIKDIPYNIDKTKIQFNNQILNVIKYYQKNNYKIIIITNQSGIGRGLFTEEEYLNFSKFIEKELQKVKIKIDKIYYCKHKPEDDCICRKPKSYLFEKAIKEFNIDVSKSIMIGDKETDKIPAENVNINKIKIIKENNDKIIYISENI